MSDISGTGPTSPVSTEVAGGSQGKRPSWTTTAFLVEALILLVVLIASMAVFTQLFAHSTAIANHADRMTQAVIVAENAAEEFSSNPASVASGREVGEGVAAGASAPDGLKVACEVESESASAGTLYTAHITVSDDSEELYALDAKRYVSGVK